MVLTSRTSALTVSGAQDGDFTFFPGLELIEQSRLIRNR